MFNKPKFVELSNGEKIAYRETGDVTKSVLVLVHGNMSSSFHFNQVVEKLADNYHIIVPDMRGFGLSSYNVPIDSLKDFALDLIELMEKIQVKQGVFLGWSTGGGVIMEMAILKQELVSKLILVESVGITGYPMFKKDEVGQPIIGQFITTKKEIASDPVQVLPILHAIETKDTQTYRTVWNALIYNVNQPEPSMYDEYLLDMLTQRNLVDVDYALVHFNISSTHNGVVQGNNNITTVKVPTLIFQGDRDLVVPKTMGEELYEALKPYAIYKTGDFGHSPFIDCLDWLVDEIKDFA